MKIRYTYYTIIAALFVMALSGCSEKMNKRVTLWRNDKIPYGTYYAYNNLHHLFREAEIQTSNTSPIQFSGLNEKSSAYIVIGNAVIPHDDEVQAMMNYIYSGNQVFISATSIGQNLLDSFRLTATSKNFFFGADSLTVSILNPGNYDSLPFTYPGKPLDNHFIKIDSSITSVLGKDASGNANFVKITYEGGGAMYLHLAPTAFTNFFLLHKQNKRYFDIAISAIPDTVSYIRWDDYYRHHTNGKNNAEKSAFSKLKEILSNEVLRWAFWLTLLLFAIIYLFESKRKQRVVPTIKKLDNTSLEFVKTIGRLYFQRKDNKNLASKMATHFLGHVRSRFNIPTSQLNEEFENKLAFKSGYPLELVKHIVQYIRGVEEKSSVSDGELLSFNDKINKFYKQT